MPAQRVQPFPVAPCGCPDAAGTARACRSIAGPNPPQQLDAGMVDKRDLSSLTMNIGSGASSREALIAPLEVLGPLARPVVRRAGDGPRWRAGPAPAAGPGGLCGRNRRPFCAGIPPPTHLRHGSAAGTGSASPSGGAARSSPSPCSWEACRRRARPDRPGGQAGAKLMRRLNDIRLHWKPARSARPRPAPRPPGCPPPDSTADGWRKRSPYCLQS